MRAPSLKRKTSWRKSKSPAASRGGSWERRNMSRTRLAMVASKSRSSRMEPRRDFAAVSVIPEPGPAAGAGPWPFSFASLSTSSTVSTMAPMLSSFTRNRSAPACRPQKRSCCWEREVSSTTGMFRMRGSFLTMRQNW